MQKPRKEEVANHLDLEPRADAGSSIGELSASNLQAQQGIIAILDALGGADCSEEKILRFWRSRELLLDQFRRKARRFLGSNESRVTTFIFNDTVLVSYRTRKPAALRDVKNFAELIRSLAVKSLAQGILFRGAIAIGRFYVNKPTNTVMGEAVSDAAEWYNLADWIGIITTPRATLIIQSLIEQAGNDIGRLMVDYPVPLKNRQVLSLKVVNWPKAFFVKGMTPCANGDKARAKCLSLLAAHGVPAGTESKYFNSMAFFDHCVRLLQEQRKEKRRRN